MKRGIYALLLTGLCLLGGYLLLRRLGKTSDAQTASTVLGPDDRSKIILDPKHHTVTRIDDTGIHKSFLNPHGPVAIVEKKDGKTVLIQRTWGTQLSPFVGGSFGSDFKFRAAIGANFFYVQRWEAGAGLMLQPGDVRDIRAFGQVGYNVYSNWILSAAVDNKKTVHILAALRF